MTDFSELKAAFDRVRAELAKAVVDQQEFVEQLMIAMLAGGHCLAEGPPGAGRALTARWLAGACGLRFDRIRCTPDLLPAELVGAGPNPDTSTSPVLVPGPLLAHVVLVDDIARLSPNTGAVVQQAIGGRAVIVNSCKYELPEPGLLVATSYVEEEDVDSVTGTQDDRFMFKLKVPYPSYAVEYELADRLTQEAVARPEAVLSAEQLVQARRSVLQVDAPPHALHYAVRLARATRVHEGEAPDFIIEWVSEGAGSRAVHYLTLAAKVRAALHGRALVQSEDIRQVAHAVLRHRVITNRNARTSGVAVDKVIDRLLYEIPEREPDDEQPPPE